MKNKSSILLPAILFLCSLNIMAQKEDNFYVVDTISLDNPILFNLSKYDGLFIVEKGELKSNSNKKRLLKYGYAYIYSDDFYYFLDNEKLNSYDYPNKGGCDEGREYIKQNNLSYSKFKEKPKKFIVGLIRASYYDKKASTADIGKTYYHRTKENVYYKILFPLCE